MSILPLLPLYLFLAVTGIPCLTVVAETFIKALVPAIAGLFGLEVKIEIVSAEYLAKLLS